MGLLTKGTPLNWEKSKEHHAYVKKHGILQFLHVWKRVKDRSRDKFLWGDEVEMLIVSMNPETRQSRLSLVAHEALEKLDKVKKVILERDPQCKWNVNFLPEFGRFMIEATPGNPYGGFTTDLALVEANMALRRAIIEQVLGPNERVISITSFPLLGVGLHSEPAYKPNGPVAQSRFVPDELIGPHPRFATLVENIRSRRQGKVCIKVPLFQDKHTSDAIEKEVKEGMHSQPSDVPDEQVDPFKDIYMDCMAFGMGMCCLQVTFQCRNIGEARQLYDHLAVLAPVMLALTAATPIFRGKLADIDVRWTVISQSVDDRPPSERGMDLSREDRVAALSGKKKQPGVINKSRYDSVDCFISQEGNLKEKYNDLDLVYHEETYFTLRANGVDDGLAKHMAHLFIRDPLVLYSENIKLDDETTTDHFENIQSTNWQTVRFKPPPANSDMGWRVEFRSMEVQITDFENAAFTVFIALLSRSILFFDLNLYMPISQVDANMRTAHMRDAVRTQNFFWRKIVKPGAAEEGKDDDDVVMMSMKEIMCGNGTKECTGLLALVHAYLDMINCDKKTRKVVNCYLELIRMRATGELLTAATWLRKFVATNPNYNHDSVINDAICYDIVETCHQIAKGEVEVPQLLANLANIKAKRQAAARAATERGLSDDDIMGATPLRGASFRLDFERPTGVQEFHENFRSHIGASKESGVSLPKVVNVN